MRWMYELSWLWKSIGILILIVAICEWCAALIYKGMKKHYGVKAAICVAIAAVILSAICIFMLIYYNRMVPLFRVHFLHYRRKG